jgi:hypothetical protein
MGSDAVIYVPGFINIGSGIQKLMGGGDIHTHTQQRDKNTECRLKMRRNPFV